jgi:CRP-like cAMP-binding protein
MKDQFRKFVENFLNISDADFALFEERAFLKHCHKNEIITKEGEVEKFLYFVAKGVIQHYFKKGKETITTELVGEVEWWVLLPHYLLRSLRYSLFKHYNHQF